jgi:hypothetical protein
VPENIDSTAQAAQATGQESTQGGEAAQTTPPTDSGATAAQSAETGQAEQADWSKVLETVSPEDLRRHPRIAGIAGELAQRREAEIRQRIEQDQAEKAAQAERDRLKKLRREDPVAYAQEMDAREELEESNLKLAKLKGETQQQFLSRIRAGFEVMPEWKEITQDDLAAIATALAGKGDDEVLGVFTGKVNEILAEKRAIRRFNDWKTKELAKEREAIRTEVSAQLLKGDTQPDLTKPRAHPDGFDPTRLPDDKYNEWYEANVLGRPRKR